MYQSDGDLNSLIDSVFGTSNNNGQLPSQAVPSSTTLDDLLHAVFTPASSTNNVSPGGDQQTTPAVDNTRSNVDGNAADCECVPYYQCQNGSILQNGVGLIDIRLQGPCDNYLEVCCAIPDVKAVEDITTPRPTARKGCGYRNTEGVGFRITGSKDNEAQFGEFPWMVAVLKKESIGNSSEKLNVYQCGGALIHPKVVLTAAHCVNGKDPNLLKIRAGEWDTQTKNEILPHQDRDVQNTIIHERFHSGALYNDFALLILEQAVNIVDNIDVICIPDAGTIFDYSRCFASGWGKDIFGKEGHYQVILKRVELPVVPHNICQNSLRTTRLGNYFKLDPSFICAGGEPGKDTCKGDGGSPLICPIKNDPKRYVQAGIVAWGIGCGEKQIPGVYANVANARHWIDQQMAKVNLDSREYQYRQF
ncbi:PREDICTED: tryptase-2-like [Ceratosolen solmsi marchali]|uniref:Phenoloxidase-activating factor 2 n=1 Tax=Ceratosolen solmsi marchali TaxID=326594 RepID=A0AAJ6VLU0_9HYME|nr:PREDICTED: tryptase-2-like [Ceratosolen solmsi marchali]